MNKTSPQNLDSIFIEGLKVNAVIGVHAWEKVQPQPLVFDIELFTQTLTAAHSDNLADTVDYAQISSEVIQLTTDSRLDLIETLAEQVCQHILQQHPAVEGVQLTLRKPHAVREANNVGIKLFRQRC